MSCNIRSSFTLNGSTLNKLSDGSEETVMAETCTFMVEVKEAGLIVTAPRRDSEATNGNPVVVQWKVRPAQLANATFTITLALEGHAPVVLTSAALLPSFSFVLKKPKDTVGKNVPATITVTGNGILTPDGKPVTGTTTFVAI